MLEVEARDPEEAFDNIDIEDAIEEMLDNGSTTIDVKFGECRPYVYKESDDCEWFDLGEIEVTDKDLNIDWFEIASDLKLKLEECERNMSKCVQNMITIKEDSIRSEI